MFFDDPPIQTAQADEAIDVVELPTGSRSLSTQVASAPLARDAVSALLPPAPRGRDVNRLAQAARQVGERLGSIITPQGSSKALYSFPAGQSRVEGPTVWLIGALWQEYGHVVVDSEVREERAGRIAIVTTIIDRINGTAYRREHHTSLAPAPAKFASKPDQVERWQTMQMQSAISKAERTTVQHFLPGWYVDVAVEAARKAFGADVLKGKTVQEAQAEAVQAFGQTFGVSQAQLEDWVGGERPLWTVTDLAEMRGLFVRLKRGELTVAGVFGGTPSQGAAPSRPAGLDSLTAPAPKQAPKRPASVADIIPPRRRPSAPKPESEAPPEPSAEPAADGPPSAEEQAEILRREREEATHG